MYTLFDLLLNANGSVEVHESKMRMPMSRVRICVWMNGLNMCVVEPLMPLYACSFFSKSL